MRTTNTRCSGAGPVFYATSLVLLAIAAASVRQYAGGAARAVYVLTGLLWVVTATSAGSLKVVQEAPRQGRLLMWALDHELQHCHTLAK